MNTNDFFWEDLLAYIEEKQVIPILGQDLLTVNINGKSANAYDLLGQRLMADLKMSPVLEDCCLSHVVSENSVLMGNRNQIYSRTKFAFDALKLPVPEPLRLLAQIADFRLFITTTFDPWMKQALDEVRFGGRSLTESVAFNNKDATDVTVNQLRSGRPIVFQLFGRLSTSPLYAVTEEDMLEYLHHLQVQPPKLLCDELRNHHLLFIGNAFPDWLARFFFRAARGERLISERDRVEFIVEDQRRVDNPLVSFFRHFSRQTNLYAGGSPVEFVRELHGRWTERHPEAKPTGNPTPLAASLASDPPFLFLSYAREDIVAVRRLRDALLEAGLNPWMDESGLAGGEDWKLKIKERIDRCALFLPIVSHATEARREGEFRVEWACAANRVPRFKGSGQEFIIPVTIDPVDFYRALVPEEFKHAHAMAAPDGAPPPMLLGKLGQILHEFSSAERRDV